MVQKFQIISEALDEVSYEWMVDNHPMLVDAIQREVGRGAKPDEIRRHVMAETWRPELARRCEQVARFLARDETGSSKRDLPERFRIAE